MLVGESITYKDILKGISLGIQPGELVCLVGPNGSGKTTLLNALTGLLPEATGKISCLGEDLYAYESKARARAIAYMRQKTALAFDFTVEAVVALGRFPWGDVQPDLVAEALERVGMYAFKERIFRTLSGGEQQLIHYARTWVQLAGSRERFLLLDEPLASLDFHHQELLMELIQADASAGAGVLLVLHDWRWALQYAGRVVVLKGGQVFAGGCAKAILTENTLRALYPIKNPEHFLARGLKD